MEQFNQQHPGGQQSFPQTNQQEKQLIAILGVQGLSYQNYSVVELKIVLQIIKHAQKAILGYVIPYQVTSQTFVVQCRPGLVVIFPAMHQLLDMCRFADGESLYSPAVHDEI